jgi:hypothetical protein
VVTGAKLTAVFEFVVVEAILHTEVDVVADRVTDAGKQLPGEAVVAEATVAEPAVDRLTRVRA